MKRGYNFHLKKPQVLPPLSGSQPHDIRSMNPLQLPDLLLAVNRCGSPAPRRATPKEYECTNNENNGIPIIKVFQPCPKESEKSDSTQNGLPDSFSKEENYLPQVRRRHSSGASELLSKRHDRENANLSRKQSETLHKDLHRKLKSLAALPLKDLKAPESKILSLPNRYPPLKAIGQGSFEN